ncbi:MAG: universal stress protein [Nitrospirota bacterium]|nr:universal stress protein [Nitrospirota bacterium]
MKILLAIDQSKDSKAAIALLRKFRWPSGSMLILLHITTLDEGVGSTGSRRLPNKKSGDSEKILLPVQSELLQLEKMLVSDTLQVQSMVVNGVPGQEILSVIQKKKIDIAVLGSRGLSRISGLLLGSVSEWVLNDASCSILIGRPTARSTKSLTGLNILLATDGSPDAWKAVDVLKSLEFSGDTTVTLLHVIKKHVYETRQVVERTGKSQAEFSKLAKDLCRDRDLTGVRLLRETRDALASSAHNIRECMALGHDAQEIIRTARVQRADLVIVGSKGVTGLRRLFMGSVAQTVSHHAPCSVLVVRSSKKS